MKSFYMLQRLVFVLVVSLVFPTTIFAYTTVSGDLSGQTWASGTTYYVSAAAFVAKNNTLTIEEGVVVKFAPNVQMNIKGTIVAIGSSSDHIVFTSRDDDSVGEVIAESDGVPSAGDWASLYFQGNSTNQGTANMDYCEVKYAGYGSDAANVYFYACTDGYISNSIIQFGSQSGLRFNSSNNVMVDFNQITDNSGNGVLMSSGNINISNCEINNNGNWAAYLDNVILQDYAGNSGSGNGYDAFAMKGTVASDLTLSSVASGFPFVFNGLVTVNKNITFTLLPGEIIKLSAGQINVKGIFFCEGTEEDPIVFTSFKDDTYGGDLNNDGNLLTQPAPGDWYTLYTQGNSSNQGYTYIDHTIFRYGGANYSGEAATVYFYACDQGELENSTIEYSAQNGLRYNSSSGLVIDNNTLSNNNGHGILNSSSNVNFSNCEISNNANWAAYLDNVTVLDYPGNSGSGNGYDAFALKGTVTDDLTLSSAATGFPFVINGLLTVNDGKSLTLPAGEIIKLSAGNIKVLGWLYSEGTEEDPIVFTSFKDDSYGGDLNNDGILTTPAPGDWYTVTAQGNSANDGKAFIDYTMFRYGGANYSGEASMVYFNQCDEGSLTNSTIELSSQSGLRVYSSSGIIVDNNFVSNNNGHGILNSSANFNISNCEISDNASWAIYLDNVSVLDYPGNSGSGNGYDAIALKGTINQDMELSSSVSGFPFVINGLLTVNDGISLTLPAGEIIKLIGGNLKVLGWLYSQGTADDPIVFTSFKDDSFGGDLNNDGILTTPAPGDWYTVTAQGNSSNDGKAFIDHTIFRYGGANYSGEAAMVYFNQCDEGYISNSAIEQSSQNGLRLYSSSGIDIDLNEISNNNGYGILNSGSIIDFSNCVLNNNANWAAYIDNAIMHEYPGNSGSGNGYDAFAVKGTIAGDMTLSSSISGFPFVINGLITVNDGVILTIPAGEIIKLSAGNIRVNGSLYCDGTSEDPIVFTSFKDDSYGGDLNQDGITSSPSAGDWYTVSLYGNSSNDGIGHLQNCLFRYGGANYTGELTSIYINQADQGYFNNNTIENSANHGVYVYASSGLEFNQNTAEYCGASGIYFRQSAVDITNCVSNNNGTHGIYGLSTETLISGCQLNNNGSWAAYMENCALKEYTGNSGNGNHYEAFKIHGTVSEDITLAESINGFPYVINGLLTVNPGSILTLLPGEIIKMSLGAIKVNGSLIADGHAKEPVIFTSFKDDDTGGDLNNDGIVSQPAPGDWYMISVNGNSTNDGIAQLDHCVFKYGGANYSGELAALYFNQDHPESFITYCTVEHSQNYGLRANSSQIKVRSSTFRDNLSYNVYIIGTTVPDLGSPFETDGGFNHFVPNLNIDYQLYYSGPTDVFAFYNDWGFYTESEIDDRIYDNEESGQAGQVMFNPWFDPDDPTYFLDPDFTVDFDIIHVGGQVQFTDESMGYPTPNSWEWDFQTNGSVDSEAQNPAHAYNSEGLKTVCLVVSNGAYEVTLIKENFVNVGNYGAADLSSVTDVPEDQGGWVYVDFTKSEFDTNTLVTSTEYYTVQLNDGNGWFSAGYSSAYGAESYSVIAHTPFDSTANSNGLIDFRVIASMDEGTYVSEVMQGYSVDNLKPMAPSGIETILENTVIHLSWDPSPDDDFNYFAIYRSEVEGEFPDEPYHTLIETSYDDVIGADDYYYYMITAFDFAGNESDGSSVISTYKSLELIIPQGWSGISTYLDPVDANIENMFAPIMSNLVLMQNQAGVFWPDENLNTLIDWDVTSGYVVKADEQSSMNITSTREKFNEIELTAGWNIIPVLSQNNINVNELFLEADIEIAKDVAGTGVYWPELNINSMVSVLTGKAYFVKANSDQTLLYPDLGQDAQATELPQQTQNLTPWNDVGHSPISHLVGFPANVIEELEKGDYIGVFNADGVCAGLTIVSDEATAITASGEDQFGGIGFNEGEQFNFKLYRSSTSEEFALEVEFVPGTSQAGQFSANGLSVVANLKFAPTGFNGVNFTNLQVYPNPAHEFVNISGIEGPAEVEITNGVGQVVYDSKLILPAKLNLLGQPEGIYFISIKSEEVTTMKKLVIK